MDKNREGYMAEREGDGLRRQEPDIETIPAREIEPDVVPEDELDVV